MPVIGEAAAMPATHSMISDLFPKDRRTASLALVAVAAPVGAMIAFAVGGIGNAAVGWRMTFVAFGGCGLVLTALMLLTIREPRRGASETRPVDETNHGIRYTVAYLVSLHSLRWLAAGASLNFLAASALLAWSAPFLIRVHAMSTAEAGAWLGVTTGVGGIAGTLLGGLAAQHLARTDPAWLLRLPAVTSVLAVPFVLLFLTLRGSSAPAMTMGNRASVRACWDP